MYVLGAVSLGGGGDSVFLGRESRRTFSPLSSNTYSDSDLDDAVCVCVCVCVWSEKITQQYFEQEFCF